MGTIHASIGLVTETCCYEGCGVMFAFTREYHHLVSNDPDRWWYCPNGHHQHYTGKSADQKLKDAEVRERALKDQLRAAIRDAEKSRQALLQDRNRISKGICPCCNRTFQNVMAHMKGQHPEYGASIEVIKVLDYECQCGRAFETLQGLRSHQTKMRGDDWDKPGVGYWVSHLTKDPVNA